jgi:predicted DNA-binding protein (MmcQ/YjbR family)
MLMTEVPGRPVVILKADPGEAHALREQYSRITPGYRMNKKHWITLESGEGVGKELVRELVADSYRLVVAHLPKAERPAGPHTYGTGTRAAR